MLMCLVCVELHPKLQKDFLQMGHDDLMNMKKRCVESFAPYDISNTAKSYLDFYKKFI